MTKLKISDYKTSIMVEGIKKSLKALILSSEYDSKSNGHNVFWTKYGLIFYNGELNPLYIIHNNTAVFRITPGLLHSEMQIHAVKNNVPDDWKVSLIEISHGLQLRIVTPTEHIPKITKLREFADKIFVQVKNSKETEWLTC